MKFFLLATLALLMTGCASVQSVSLTPIPSRQERPISAQVSKTVFLAFNFDNDFVNPLVEDLKRQCPNGIVSGILTKHEVYSYVIVFKHQVTATGFCTQSVARNEPIDTSHGLDGIAGPAPKKAKRTRR